MNTQGGISVPKLRRSVWVGLAALTVVAAVTWAAAKAPDAAVFRQTYGAYIKDGTDLAKAMPCTVCHTAMPPAKTNLNPYGADVGKAAAGKAVDAKILQSIEKLDSDKDGFSNLDEIKAGTHPGNPASKPRK